MEEIFSEVGKTAEDGAGSLQSAAIASVDAANCYDSIAHAIASLIFQACGVPVEGIKAMLSAIQDMKYFLERRSSTQKTSKALRLRSSFKVYAKATVQLRPDGRQLVSP
eukprot:scaffold15956_cov32-Cyclotella_meneghiniana.AAC.2